MTTLNQQHPIFGGSPAQGSTASRYDAIVTIGGGGVWEVSKIVASYYDLKPQQHAVAGLGFNPRGRLTVVRGEFSRLTPASFALTNDPLGTVKPDDILLDVPWNPSFVGSKNGARIVAGDSCLPLILDFPRGEEIGSLKTDDGGKLSVILFAGTIADDADLVYFNYVQCLHVCAHRLVR
jgi:hypothetical protein